MNWLMDLKNRWTDLLSEYGRIAIFTYLVLWIAVLVAFGLAIVMGIEVEGVETSSAAGVGAVLVGSWVAAKITQPFRIAATLVLTPMVAKVLQRLPASREE